MTLKYHPDKNSDPEAAEIFIKISKSYEVLTDPNKKAIFEKYGNPDGPSSLSVSIAFPSFLLKPENHVLILVTFFLFILIVVPCNFLN